MQLLVPEPRIFRQQSQHSNTLRIAENMHRQGINSYVATYDETYVLSRYVPQKSLTNCGNYNHETLLL